MKSKIAIVWLVVGFFSILPTNVNADLTKEQAEDVALFATTLIEKGNARRDENGYPLMVYALSNNAQTCIEIRRSGYKEELYHVKNNNYHKKNGKYLDLGLKWCMDCGDYISYVYKTTLGLDMFLEEIDDPWHIKDIYADANKKENSQYFYFVYKNVPISSIKEENLQKGDIVVRMGSRENHGLIYVGENMQTAHASRNAIKYSKNPPILGFEVVQLNKFYKTSTIVSIVRVKDQVVDLNQKVNAVITWPDTGEKEILFGEEVCQVENEEILKIQLMIDEELEENKKINPIFESVKVLGNKGENEIVNEDNILNNETTEVKKHILNWIILELKRFLMKIY